MGRIILIFLLIANFLFAEYANDRIMIRLRPGVSAAGIKSNQDLPDSIKKLNEKHHFKQLKSAVDIKGIAASASSDKANRRWQKFQTLCQEYGLDRTYEIVFDQPVDLPMVMELYKNNPQIESVEQCPIYHAFAVPNDPLVANQDVYLKQISAYKGWDIMSGSSSTVIAILDTGVNLTHPDLQAKIASGGYDYINNDTTPQDDEGHGTAVAGITAAAGNNSIGVCGINWSARILPMKVLDSNGDAHSYSDITNAISNAVSQGADVINMSFGGPGYNSGTDLACKAAYNSGVLLVAAIGNYNTTDVFYPAGHESVIAVGSINSSGTRSSFSNYGSYIEVVAPGEHIYTTTRNGSLYADVGSGTSFAAPMVSGLCALMKAKHPTMTNVQIRKAINDAADNLGPTGWDREYGWGCINVENALKLTNYSDASPTIKNIYNYPNPVTNDETRFSFQINAFVKEVTAYVYDIKGRLVNELEYGAGNGAPYYSDIWDCTGKDGEPLANGTYIYVLKIMDGNGDLHYVKGKLVIVR